jgi:type II secretory pathway pseudopilin PulG
MTASSASSRRGLQRGFSLVELAVVFSIVVLLLGSLMYTLGAQIENRAIADTQRRLEDAKELIVAFAMVNGRLPCPASSTSNGDEAAAAGVCTNYYSGFLPARAIGFTPVDTSGYGLDVWGNRIRYAVSQKTTLTDNIFVTASGIKNNFGGTTALAPKDLLVCSAFGTSGSVSTSTPSCGISTDPTPGYAVTNLNTVVAVVWSQGKNVNTVSFGSPAVAGQASADEALNNKTASNSNHGVFVHHPPRTPFDGAEYDDQVVWIPVGLLFSRMISAGVLP